MRWRPGARRSGNVEDGRGMGGLAVGGGLGTIVLALVAMLFGVDPGAVLQQQPPAQGEQAPAGAPSADDPQRVFVEQVLGDTETTWGAIFQQMGRTYEEPRLRLFTGGVQSACGFAQTAVGPFYCPADRKIYIDLAFYKDLERMSNARTDFDFARAYVLAHEVGHHVQTVLGISDRVAAASRGVSEEVANQLSVRQELQADCFAGLWGHGTRTSGNVVLEPGDVEEALSAAAAIGDDRLQQQSQGHVVPESFTHGSSAQRVQWFRRGFESGDFRQCDTFAANAL